MSQLSSCRSLKPTARWWFSSTDESLYIKASSESGDGDEATSQTATTTAPRWDNKCAVSKLTGVDEELIGNSGVIHVMDGAGKQGGQDLQISEHSLDFKNTKAIKGRSVQDGSS